MPDHSRSGAACSELHAVDHHTSDSGPDKQTNGRDDRNPQARRFLTANLATGLKQADSIFTAIAIHGSDLVVNALLSIDARRPGLAFPDQEMSVATPQNSLRIVV